jgi:uncharacterized protein (DUF2236 family)
MSLVSEEDFERELDRVRGAARNPTAGIFGPGSLTWRVDREAVIFVAAGRALLLQLAHPWVAAAITEHSRTLADPIGRFHRTFSTVFAMVFGTLDQALSMARRLHRRHAQIGGILPMSIGPYAEGSPYHANDVSALRWVWATLVDSALLAYELVSPSLTHDERERYYVESRSFAALFGIPASQLPTDWNAFAAFNRSMWQSEVLTVSPAAGEIARQILSGTGLWLHAPDWYRAVTANLLPPRLRAGFGLAYGEPERRAAERALSRISRIYPALPNRLRHVGPYHEAMARLSGRAQPDLATRWLNRLWVGQPRL